MLHLCLHAALAEVEMPAWFGDNMVLQTNAEYGARSFLNGRAKPGEKVVVSVSADGRQFLATADFTREIYDEAALFTDEIDTCKHCPADRTSVPRDTERPPFPPRWLPQIRCPNSSRAPQRW